MSKKLFIFIICLILLALFLTVPKYLLFYDSPEFFNIINSNSFIASLGLGHPPIRPIFVGLFWILTHFFEVIFKTPPEYSANLGAFIFGAGSILLFLKLSRYFLDKPSSYLATLIFSLFPTVWTLNTNLTVESPALTLFILTAILFMNAFIRPTFLKIVLYSLGIFILVGTHVVAISWIVSLFALPLLLLDTLRKERVSFLKLFLVTLIVIPLSLFLYQILFNRLKTDASLITSTSQNIIFLSFFFLGNIVRNILLKARNLSFRLIYGFGTLIPFLFLYLTVKLRKNIRFLVGALIFILSMAFFGTIWEGDFMPKRIAFVAVILALVLVKYFQKKSALIIIYLLPIILFNSLLYLNTRNNIPLIEMKRAESLLPKGGVLAQTHYVRPFTFNYDGSVLWIDEGDLERIKEESKTKRVFLDSQAIFTPYLQYVGNNLHITSLGKFGKSDSQSIFPLYTFDLAEVMDPSQRVFIYELKKRGESFETRVEYNKHFINKDTSLVLGTAQPGSPVYIYSNKFFQTIHRERIDYGDILTWVGVVLTGRHEPLGWTYADKDGFFVYPISSRDEKTVYVTGPELIKTLIINQKGIIFQNDSPKLLFSFLPQ